MLKSQNQYTSNIRENVYYLIKQKLTNKIKKTRTAQSKKSICVNDFINKKIRLTADLNLYNLYICLFFL